jgi:hypothetical protein
MNLLEIKGKGYVRGDQEEVPEPENLQIGKTHLRRSQKALQGSIPKAGPGESLHQPASRSETALC